MPLQNALLFRGKPKVMTKPKNTRRSKRFSLLPVVHPNAAGIDVGSRLLVVAVPAERADPTVRELGSFTAERQAIARWLRECGVDTVALEAPGV